MTDSRKVVLGMLRIVKRVRLPLLTVAVVAAAGGSAAYRIRSASTVAGFWWWSICARASLWPAYEHQLDIVSTSKPTSTANRSAVTGSLGS